MYLSHEEFIIPILTFKFGTYEEVLRIIFNIFDFDSDGLINSKDVRHIISYLPVKNEGEGQK